MALLAGISNPETFKLALQWSWIGGISSIKTYFVESVIVLSVIVDRLPNKDALLARVVVFPLVVDFNVLFHHTVLARLERAPGANTSKRNVYHL